jgi:hypothetical protein
MKTELYAANVQSLLTHDAPGCEEWAQIYKLIGMNVSFVDRTEEIICPFNVKLYPKFKMPTDIIKYEYTYEECCNKKATELYNLSKQLDKPIYVFYSGGIDSTLVVISLKKVMPDAEFHERVVLLMDYESVRENPVFYETYIRGKIKTLSSQQFNRFFDKSAILVGGEFNDQLFGSDLVKEINVFCGFDGAFKKYTRELIVAFFNFKGLDSFSANRWYDLVDESCKKSPVPLTSVFDFLWWLNFNYKFQSVFFRILMRCSAEQQKNINQDFVDNYYHHFFGDEYFQIWSMTNHENKIKKEWTSYKYIAKELIFEYNHDADYRDYKTKVPSLYKIFLQRKTPAAITSDYQYLYELNTDELYVPYNSFYRKL